MYPCVGVAANYILATEAMVAMATELGEAADATRYRRELVEWRAAYHTRFYNKHTGNYCFLYLFFSF